jgi:SAM-dependent methyltransferase
MVDIRPLALSLNTLNFRKGSILDLPFENDSVESLSSLCVVEHIGLGRYGDPLDPSGSEKAVAELCRVIRPNGHLYISVPIDDRNRVFFNAHRAFEEKYFEQLLFPLEVIEKEYISGESLSREKPIGFSIALYHAVKRHK